MKNYLPRHHEMTTFNFRHHEGAVAGDPEIATHALHAHNDEAGRT